MGAALNDVERLCVSSFRDLVHKPIGVIDTAAPEAIEVFQGFWLADACVAVPFNVLDECVDSLQCLFVFKLPSRVFIPSARREGDVHAISVIMC